MPVMTQPIQHQKTKAKTKIHAHFNCGFANNLFIRGDGIASLSWDKGLAMKNIAPDEWVWETDRPFSTAHVKFLVNDDPKRYEAGENHTIAFGDDVTITPRF